MNRDGDFVIANFRTDAIERCIERYFAQGCTHILMGSPSQDSIFVLCDRATVWVHG